MRLNPDYASAHQWYGWLLMVTRRWDEMLAAMQRAHDLDPLSLVINEHYGDALSLVGREKEAIAALRPAVGCHLDNSRSARSVTCSASAVNERRPNNCSSTCASDRGGCLCHRSNPPTFPPSSIRRTRHSKRLSTPSPNASVTSSASISCPGRGPSFRGCACLHRPAAPRAIAVVSRGTIGLHRQ